MDDLSELEPNLRACALVGLYLQSWASMEGILNITIQKIFGLTSLQNAILVNNLQFRDKIHIINTASNLEFGEKSADAKKTSKLLTAIKNGSNDRNMMAHESFGPNEKKTGVVWFVIKAKGKITFPDADWDEDKFNKKIDQIDKWYDDLKDLQKNLTKSKLMKAYIDNPQPNLLQGLLGNSGPQTPLVLAAQQLGSSIASLGKAPQTSQKPEE